MAMANDVITAIEFFSGIGAFAEACRGTSILVVAAYDQNHLANQVYEANFKQRPIGRNLESIPAVGLPKANLWWMSPPCTPFTRRGKRRDDQDPRAKAFLNLIELIPQCLPDHLFVENVECFEGGKVCERLIGTLVDCGYTYRSMNLCSSDFGVPMRRPRYFLAASKTDSDLIGKQSGSSQKFVSRRVERLLAAGGNEWRERTGIECLNSNTRLRTPGLADYLDKTFAEQLIMAETDLERFRPVLNIVDPDDENAYVICFTRGYYKCRKASGSLIQLPNGRARFISPEEILRLLGFSEQFVIPEDMPLAAKFRLVGNSVDVRALRAVIHDTLHM